MNIKYYKEIMVEVDGEEVPRRSCFRMPIIKEGANGEKVRIFANKVMRVNEDGSLNNGLPKLTKAEKKLAKRNRHGGI